MPVFPWHSSAARTDVAATYGYLSTGTRPLAEMGYYVFPVTEVDEPLKENGMPTAGEMHQVPLNKVSEIIGADAVLYIDVDNYGSKCQVINSATVVEASARLVDTKTGTTLWQGHAQAPGEFWWFEQYSGRPD